MTRRNLLLLHFATCGFVKQRYMLQVSATMVHAHHEIGAGHQHEAGEGKNCKAAQKAHTQEQI